MASACEIERQRHHFRLQRRRQQKHRQNAYYGPQRFVT